MSEDTPNLQLPAPGRYLSLVVHLWVGEDGELLRGTIADAHTGKWLAIDLSALAALLRESLAHAPGQVGNAQDEGAMTEEMPAIEPEKCTLNKTEGCADVLINSILGGQDGKDQRIYRSESRGIRKHFR